MITEIIEQTIIDYSSNIVQEVIIQEETISELGQIGHGVASGGTTGQVLAKKTNTNYDTEWITNTGGGGGISDAPNNANAYVRGQLSWLIGYTKTAIDALISGFQTAVQVQTIADAKVVQTITNGVTATAPSEDAVFDALALKANNNAVVHLTGTETITGIKSFLNGAIFSPLTNPTYAKGLVFYDDSSNSLAYYDDISGTTNNVNYEQSLRARNNTGSTIVNGSVVYISGALGQNPTIALARANVIGTCEVVGVATHDISNNTVGKVTTFGLVNDINTSVFTEGQVAHLSTTTAGLFTTTAPSSPNYLVTVGTVLYSHSTQGKIFVRPTEPLSLNTTIGSSNLIGVSENVVKTYVNAKISDAPWGVGAEGAVDIASSQNAVFNGIATIYAYAEDLDNNKQPLAEVLTNTTASFTTADETKLDKYPSTATNGKILQGNGSDYVEVDMPSGGTTQIGAFKMLANNTNASAVPTEKPFINISNAVYSGVIVWVGGAAPTVPTHTYSLSQVGNVVTLIVNLAYGTVGGGGLTSVAFELPTGAPTPLLPTSVTTAGDVLSYVSGNITTTKTQATTNPISTFRLKSTSPNVFEVSIARTAAAYRYAYATIQYITAL